MYGVYPFTKAAVAESAGGSGVGSDTSFYHHVRFTLLKDQSEDLHKYHGPFPLVRSKLVPPLLRHYDSILAVRHL